MRDKPDYLCKIPNDQAGAFFLYQLQNFLHPSLCVRVRGSAPDRTKIKKAGEKPSYYRYGIPVRFAKELRVYVCQRNGGGRGRVVGQSLVEYNKRLQADISSAAMENLRAFREKNELLCRMKIIKQCVDEQIPADQIKEATDNIRRF